MKALIIYQSNYKHNTEKIAEVFANKIECTLMNINDFHDENIKDYDVIGFGSGVYKESLSPKIYELVENLDLKGKNVFVFSTSGCGMKFYNKKLIKKLEEKHAIVKGSFACKGYFKASEFSNNKIFDIMGKLAEGHPNSKDLKKAESFIVNLSKSL